MRAILITEENAEKIAIVNSGIVPTATDGNAFFVDPENADGYNQIYARDVFFELYQFSSPRDNYMSDRFHRIEPK